MFGVNDTDGKRVFVDSASFFERMTNMMPLEDTGLYFHDEIKVSEDVSVITDKRVSIGSPEETVKTYHKVVEMVELNEMEIEEMNKFRYFFKKLFEVFFKGKKGLVAYTTFLGFSVGLDIYTKDWFGLILNIALICMWNSPIKFYKEIKKMLVSDKKKEAIREELAQLGIDGSLTSVSKDGIQLYYQPRIGR